MVLLPCTREHFFLHLEQFGFAQTTRLHLVDPLFSSLGPPKKKNQTCMVKARSKVHPHLLLVLELVCNSQYLGNVVGKSKLCECFLNVIHRYRLLCLFFRDIVGLGRDQGDELDAALNEEISCISGKDLTIRGRKDFRNDLLDGCCKQNLSNVRIATSFFAFGLYIEERVARLNGHVESPGELQMHTLWKR
jgi:hypothetical protein